MAGLWDWGGGTPGLWDSRKSEAMRAGIESFWTGEWEEIGLVDLGTSEQSDQMQSEVVTGGCGVVGSPRQRPVEDCPLT